jgi:Glycoside hydrolase 97/Glycosyl-hydrolase 97 N-terminal/Glycosyl-hydrolase 97 C-terminal, oligomerisation
LFTACLLITLECIIRNHKHKETEKYLNCRTFCEGFFVCLYAFFKFVLPDYVKHFKINFMSRFRYVQIILLLSLPLFASAQNSFSGIFRSPNNSVSLSLSQQQDGITYFTINLNGKTVIDLSPVGIETSNGSFYTDMHLTKRIQSRMVTNNYDLNIGKFSHIKNRYKEVTLKLANLQSRRMDLIFRISNDGVAYRYKIYGSGDCIIFREHGAFQIPVNATAFMTPMSKSKSGWKQTNPSYEEHYLCDIPVGTPSPLNYGWTYPALFHVSDDAWVLLSETGTDGNYCGTHLAHNSIGGLYKIEFPHSGEGLPGQLNNAKMTLPYETPWRMMILAENQGKVAESTMATDLVEQVYMPKFVYKPGKATWSWLVLKDDSVTYDVTRRFIDMADQLDFAYCLIDAPWDVQIGRDNIEELSAYAISKGVGLLLWYNSNGHWNDAPQTPKDKMDVKSVRREEMKWMQKIGIKGIKVDFFGGDKQFYMKYYQDILTDANDFGLTVNFHGTTLPRGWEKMYPNFVTDESVKGMEYITFLQENADLQPQHCATLPFIRNVVGPMDFTPLVLNERLGIDGKSGPIRRTTAAFELALPVIFFSGVQHFGLVPENLMQFPNFVSEYLRAVPTVWDETRFLSGYPGMDCVIARRTGNVWYVAGINGENTEKKMTFELGGIIRSKSRGFAIVDKTGENNQVEKINVIAPSKNSEMVLKVPAYGGFVMIFPNVK